MCSEGIESLQITSYDREEGRKEKTSLIELKRTSLP